MIRVNNLFESHLSVLRDVLRTDSGRLIRWRSMPKKWPALFKGRHFEPEIIMLCVRRYLRLSLSYGFALGTMSLARLLSRPVPEQPGGKLSISRRVDPR